MAAATEIDFLMGGAVATLASARAVYVAAGLAILVVTVLVLAPRTALTEARDRLLAMSRSAVRVAPARPSTLRATHGRIVRAAGCHRRARQPMAGRPPGAARRDSGNVP